MSKETDTQPASVDATKTASAQTASNIQTAIANAVIGNANTYSPYGSTTYTQTGTQKITGEDGTVYEVPQYSQNTTLSPTQQTLYDQGYELDKSLNTLAKSQTDKLTGVLDQTVDTSTLPALAQAPSANTTDYSTGVRGMKATNYADTLTNDFSADRTAVEQALFDRLNPQLDRSKAALENSLVNQGFQRGTEAFNAAMDESIREANDARLAVTAQGLTEQQGLYEMARNKAGFSSSEEERAFNQALSAGQFGSNEENRAYNTALSSATFQNQARDQALQETLSLRNQPINEISALTSGTQVQLPTTYQYNAPQVANTDYSGAVYNSAALQNQNYKTETEANSKALSGLYGLGSSAVLGGLTGGTGSLASSLTSKLWGSDRRLKRDIRDLGLKLANGLKLYAYRYAWETGERAGVMADEVLTVNPAAVVSVDGYLHVNYRMLAHG